MPMAMGYATPETGTKGMASQRRIGAEVFKCAAPDNHTFLAVTAGRLCITR
jgi:hypothetical protein